MADIQIYILKLKKLYTLQLTPKMHAYRTCINNHEYTEQQANLQEKETKWQGILLTTTQADHKQ